MSDSTTKVKGITLLPIDPSTISNPENGDLIVDSTDGNAVKKWNGLEWATAIASDTDASISFAGYNTTEQVTERRWIDGKPIYRKVISLGDLSSQANDINTQGSSSYGASLPNLDYIVSTNVIFATSAGVQYLNQRTFYNGDGNQIRWWVQDTTLYFYWSTNYAAQLEDVKVLVEYTKATDTSSSPIAKAKLSHDGSIKLSGYSDTEQVTERRWSDGKPIYRKVCYVASDPIHDGTTRTVAFTDAPSNVETTVYATFDGGRSDGYSYLNGTNGRVVRINVGTGVVNYNIESGAGAQSVFYTGTPFILEYTKTTDTANSPTATLSLSHTGNVKLSGYDTTETLTENRWLDGKPIYRKVVQLSANPIVDDAFHLTAWSDPPTDVGTFIRGYRVGNDRSGRSYYDAAAPAFSERHQVQYNGLYARYGTSNTEYYTTSDYFVLEYTKSTDTASSPTATVSLSTTGNLKFSGYDTAETLTERRWTDGKPIYRKYVALGDLSANANDTNTEQTASLGLTGFDTITDSVVVFGNGTNQFLNQRTYYTSDSSQFRYYLIDDDLKYTVSTNLSGQLQDVNVIVEYTKTADTIDSPTAEVSLSHAGNLVAPSFESTEVLTERRWIDGKPLYRKVIYSNSLTTNSQNLLPHGLTGVDYITIERWAVERSDGKIWGHGYYVDATTNIFMGVDATNVLLDFDHPSFTATQAWIVLEYTKTADTSNSPTAALAAEIDASTITYDNTTSGLTATTMQGAVDEVEGRVDTLEGTAQTVSVSDEGTPVEATATDINFAGDLVLVTDDTDGTVTVTVSNPSATQTSYSNATSGLTATDTQAAIDEVEGRVDTLEGTSQSVSVSEEGTPVVATATDLNFVGSDVTVTDDTDGTVSVTFTDHDTARVYTTQQNFGTTTLTDAANISWDLSGAQVATVTLADNRTLDNPTNMVDGGRYVLRVVQDATGSRTLSYGTAYKWAGGTAPTLSTGANAVDIIVFESDGTNMYGIPHLNFS